jgi:hypothetical protein
MPTSSAEKLWVENWKSRTVQQPFGFDFSLRRGNQNNNKVVLILTLEILGRVENLDFQFGSSSTIKTKQCLKKRPSATIRQTLVGNFDFQLRVVVEEITTTKKFVLILELKLKKED